MTSIVIVGAGGYARVVAETLRQRGTPAAGYVDQSPAENFAGLPYLGDDAALLSKGAGGVLLASGIGSVDVPHVRRGVFDRYKAAGFSFATVVHPSALMASDVALAEGAQVMAGAILQSNVRIGRNVIVNVGVIIDHDSSVGDHSHLATGAVLAGAVKVGEATLIGAGATIIQGVRVGSKALVGAGAAVVADVADGGRVGGVPAHPIGKRA